MRTTRNESKSSLQLRIRDGISYATPADLQSEGYQAFHADIPWHLLDAVQQAGWEDAYGESCYYQEMQADEEEFHQQEWQRSMEQEYAYVSQGEGQR